MAAKTEIPERLSITLSFGVDREYVEDNIANGEEVTLQMMLDALRDSAYEILSDDLYNIVQTAQVFDESGDPVT